MESLSPISNNRQDQPLEEKQMATVDAVSFEEFPARPVQEYQSIDYPAA